jgi:hypothetical protein
MKTFYWYRVIVEFTTEDEKSGKLKKVKEAYLVKGVNPGDAEKTVNTVLGETGGISDYRIKDIKEDSALIRVIVPEGIEMNDQ